MANPALIQALRERARKRAQRAKQYTPPGHPHGAETRYRRALLAYVRSIRVAVETHVIPIIDRDGDGVADGSIPVGELGRAWARVRADIVSLEAESAAARMVEEVNAYTVTQLNRAYAGAIGVKPFSAGPVRARTDAPSSVESELAEALFYNVRLIRTIAPTLLDQVQETVGEGYRAGLRVEDLSKQIAERFGVAESRANLIARDQTGKLNAKLTETRNREVGATRYVWQISGSPEGDGRVRDMHAELDGQTFRYDDPPVTNLQGDRNNPGEDYQCRCSALPVLEDVLEALGI